MDTTERVEEVSANAVGAQQEPTENSKPNQTSAVKKIDPNMGWFLSTECLPPVGREVLVIVDRRVEVSSLTDILIDGDLMWDLGYKDGLVTHWQRLPPVPLDCELHMEERRLESMKAYWNNLISDMAVAEKNLAEIKQDIAERDAPPAAKGRRRRKTVQ